MDDYLITADLHKHGSYIQYPIIELLLEIIEAQAAQIMQLKADGIVLL